MGEKRFTLLYDGQEIQLGSHDHGLFDGFDGSFELRRIDLGDGVYVTVAMGPGIPLAIYEAPAPAGS